MSALIFHVCSHRDGNCKRLLLCSVLLLSIASTLLASLQRLLVSLRLLSFVGAPASEFRALIF